MSGTWLGLDLGTSSLKGLLVDDEGRVLGRGRSPYPTRRAGVRVEQDAHSWHGPLRDVVAQCCRDRRPDGVALVGHTPSLVLADAHREAVEPVLSWQDSRAADEARELADRCGPPEGVVGTPLPWGPGYLPAKLLWIARHRPAGLHRTRWLLQPKDYLAYLLIGEAATDLWSSKGLCRVDDGSAVSEVFSTAGVDPTLLPPRRDPWQALGVVDAEGADRTGLPPGTPVAAAGATPWPACSPSVSSRSRVPLS